MSITFKDSTEYQKRKVSFADIPEGEYFRTENYLYFKLPESSKGNCYCVAEHTVTSIFPDSKVYPLHTQVIYEFVIESIEN